jgi:hypothetical protein
VAFDVKKALEWGAPPEDFAIFQTMHEAPMNERYLRMIRGDANQRKTIRFQIAPCGLERSITDIRTQTHYETDRPNIRRNGFFRDKEPLSAGSGGVCVSCLEIMEKSLIKHRPRGIFKRCFFQSFQFARKD